MTEPTDQAIERVEALLERLDAARARLEATEDAEAAIDVLAELSEIAKQVEVELSRTRAEADADS